MINRALPAVLVLMTASFIAACQPPGAGTQSANPVATGPAVATVNGKTITQGLFDFYVESRTRNPAENVTPENRERLMDEMVQLYVVATAAERDGIAADPKVASQIELQKMNVLAQNYVKKFVDANPVSDEDLQAGYDAASASGGPSEYKARHILLKTEDEAKAVIKELDGGKDFAKLAEEKSTGPSAKDGGDLGWFSADRMVPEFSEAVMAMEKGTYTKAPVQTQFGWHVILAEDTRQGEAPSFDAYRQENEPTLQQEKVQAVLDKLRAEATVNIVSEG